MPNPSFEEYYYCYGVDAAVKKWTININTANYFNSCYSNSSEYSVPQNSWGYQNAADGNAYYGFYSFVRNLAGYDAREYFGTKLVNSLDIGQKYYFSFKVSLANNLTCAHNNIGVLFKTDYNGEIDTILNNDTIYETISETPPFSFINNFAHINHTSMITDTANWTTVTGSFTADSSYRYIIIGNFFEYDLTDTLLFSGNTCGSYHYVDDICLSNDSSYCDSITKIKSLKSELSTIEIYPNPALDIVSIKFNKTIIDGNLQIKLFDMMGNNCNNKISIKQKGRSEYSILNKNLSKGIYLLKINNDQYSYTEKLIFY